MAKEAMMMKDMSMAKGQPGHLTFKPTKSRMHLSTTSGARLVRLWRWSGSARVVRAQANSSR